MGDGLADGVSSRFELLIDKNKERFYELESWQLSRVVHQHPRPGEGIVVNETIVAVFVYVGDES